MNFPTACYFLPWIQRGLITPKVTLADLKASATETTQRWQPPLDTRVKNFRFFGKIESLSPSERIALIGRLDHASQTGLFYKFSNKTGKLIGSARGAISMLCRLGIYFRKSAKKSVLLFLLKS